jgi:hypothetical protein
MSTKPISENELNRLLDLAADAPDYNHEKLLDTITAQVLPSARETEQANNFLLITVIKRPFWTAGIAFSIAALGIFTGIAAEILYGELLTTALIVDAPVDFHTSLLLI